MKKIEITCFKEQIPVEIRDEVLNILDKYLENKDNDEDELKSSESAIEISREQIFRLKIL